MKYILTIALLLLLSHVRGQMKVDTTKPQEFVTTVGAQDENLVVAIKDGNLTYVLSADPTRGIDYTLIRLLVSKITILEKKIDSLERRPYLFIDTKPSSSGIWLTNSAGEYQWLIKPFNYK